MKKHIDIKLTLFIVSILILGSNSIEVYAQPDPPGGPRYSSHSYTTIKTPKGENVEASLYTDAPDWPEYWEALGAWMISEDSWDATWVAAATHEYNCHGYAWHVSEGGSNVYITNKDRYNNDNLSKYWSGLKSYTSGGAHTIGKKIYYSNADHSAITTTSSSRPGPCSTYYWA